MPHIPTRMCVICRQRFAKQSLTRMVINAQGVMVRDARQTLPGRGVYVCNNAVCQEKIQKYAVKKPRERRKSAPASQTS